MQIRARGSAFGKYMNGPRSKADSSLATGIGNWLVSTFWSQVSPIVSAIAVEF
jgi:hypothetical protein